jgi:hypothetical protein
VAGSFRIGFGPEQPNQFVPAQSTVAGHPECRQECNRAPLGGRSPQGLARISGDKCVAKRFQSKHLCLFEAGLRLT